MFWKPIRFSIQWGGLSIFLLLPKFECDLLSENMNRIFLDVSILNWYHKSMLFTVASKRIVDSYGFFWIGVPKKKCFAG